MTAQENVQRMAIVEMAVALHFARKCKGLVAPNAEGRDKEKDFTILSPTKMELKMDEKCSRTGNVFFELNNSRLNEPSGLRATKAEVWTYYLPGRHLLFWFAPSKMLAWLSDREPSPKYIVGAGDANADGYIVPLAEVLSLQFVASEPFVVSWDVPPVHAQSTQQEAA